MTPAGLLVRREIATALRARWFAAYAVIFLLSGLLLAGVGGGTPSSRATADSRGPLRDSCTWHSCSCP